jgi:hypothetical protein
MVFGSLCQATRTDKGLLRPGAERDMVETPGLKPQ